MEWALVSERTAVVGTREGYDLHELSDSDRFRVPMEGQGTPQTTHNLLLGAVAAAHRDAPAVAYPPFTEARYVWRLAAHQLTTTSTPRLMAELADRFAAEGRLDLAKQARWVAKEESHGSMVVEDIAALGYDPDDVLAAFAPPGALALVEMLTRHVRGPEPVRAFGHAFAVEQSAMQRTPEVIRAIEAVLPPGVRATRTVRVHSGLGADVDHVQTLLEFIAGFPPADRAAVAQAAYETTLVIRTPLPGEFPPEEWLEEKLASARTEVRPREARLSDSPVG